MTESKVVFKRKIMFFFPNITLIQIKVGNSTMLENLEFSEKCSEPNNFCSL